MPVAESHVEESRKAVIEVRNPATGEVIDSVHRARVDEVERAIRDVQQKRKTTRYLHLGPRILEAVIPESIEVAI